MTSNKEAKSLAYYKKNPGAEDVVEMLLESNKIEREYGAIALEDALTAWKYAIENVQNITTKYVLAIHKRLMKNLNPRIAGKTRQCDVYIGGDCRHYISDNLIMSELKRITDIINNSVVDRKLPEKDKEQLAKSTHIAYEYWHGYEDGNGRSGRIIYNIHRLRLGLPLHVIHEGKEQMDYYQWFR